MIPQYRKVLTAIGLSAFTVVVATYPILYVSKGPTVATAGEGDGLNGDAIVRGAYVNAGSRDIGRDPKAGTYGHRLGD